MAFKYYVTKVEAYWVFDTLWRTWRGMGGRVRQKGVLEALFSIWHLCIRHLRPYSLFETLLSAFETLFIQHLRPYWLFETLFSIWHPFGGLGRPYPMQYYVWSDDHSVVVVLRSPIHANEPSEYNGMLYRTSNQSTKQRNKGHNPNLHGWDFSIPPSPITLSKSLQRLRRTVREAFSYAIRRIPFWFNEALRSFFIQSKWNIPYPKWKYLTYTTALSLYYPIP